MTIVTRKGYIGIAGGLLALAVLAACGGSGSSGGGGGVPAVSQGVFVNSAVGGIRFETDTEEGFTDVLGTFSYRAGETVSFYLGGILLGSAEGAPVLTPIDIVPGASGVDDPRVTNISRLLQSLDQDGIPENGISIHQFVYEALLDQTLDLDLSISEFEDVAGPLVATLTATYHGGARDMVTAALAQSRLAQTLASLEDPGNGGPGGTLSISGPGAATIGNSFTPSGPFFPFFGDSFVNLQMNSSPQGEAVIGLGTVFLPDGTPISVSLVWQTLTSGTLNFQLDCDQGDCSGLTADFAAREVVFQNVTLQSGIGDTVTLNGTLTY